MVKLSTEKDSAACRKPAGSSVLLARKRIAASALNGTSVGNVTEMLPPLLPLKVSNVTEVDAVGRELE